MQSVLSEDAQYVTAPIEEGLLLEIYWATKGKAYPTLQQLARRILSMPASSGSVEQLFFASGAIIIARRNQLSAITVESLLLTKECQKFQNRNSDSNIIILDAAPEADEEKSSIDTTESKKESEAGDTLSASST